MDQFFCKLFLTPVDGNPSFADKENSIFQFKDFSNMFNEITSEEESSIPTSFSSPQDNYPINSKLKITEMINLEKFNEHCRGYSFPMNFSLSIDENINLQTNKQINVKAKNSGQKKKLSIATFMKKNWKNKFLIFRENRKQKLLSKIYFTLNNKINNFSLTNLEKNRKDQISKKKNKNVKMETFIKSSGKTNCPKNYQENNILHKQITSNFIAHINSNSSLQNNSPYFKYNNNNYTQLDINELFQGMCPGKGI